MGENMHESFRHNLKYQSWPVFARDQIAEDVLFISIILFILTTHYK